MNNVMIDLETLGHTADAVIMSIGAVEFELNGAIGRKFYRSISIDSNLDNKRRVAESTLLWWLQQAPAAQNVFHEPKITLEAALDDLADWFPKNDDVLVWSNGASFDIPMLEHAYCQQGLESPWAHHQSRCIRTYKNLPGADKIERVEPTIKHRADDDALAQVLTLQRIHAHLFPGTVEVV